MNNFLSKLWRYLAVLGAMLAMYWRSRAAAEKAQAEQQRADQAEAATQQLTAINNAREELQKKHRQEQANEERQIANGDRSHFDNTWK